MVYLHYKLRGKEYYYDALSDFILVLVYYFSFIIGIAIVNGSGKDGIVMIIAVGLIGVGIIVASVSAVVCKFLDSSIKKKEIEAECFKYEVKEKLKYVHREDV